MSTLLHIKKLLLKKPNELKTIVRKQFTSKTRMVKFTKEFYAFKKQIAKDVRFPIRSLTRWPILDDKQSSVPFDRQYFYHPSWAARVLAENRPSKHVDISSILRFVGDISAFIPTEYYEFQAPDISLSNLTTGSVDLTNLPFDSHSIESLSCMHVVEHIGLGRYGDDIDPHGDLKAAAELQRVVRNGGMLLFVVPIAGLPRIEFNAHRVYTYDMIVDMFPKMELLEFALIPDKKEDGNLIRNADPKTVLSQVYACGCFHFRKGIRP
jgi:SAM-dependent methyltransferase